MHKQPSNTHLGLAVMHFTHTIKAPTHTIKVIGHVGVGINNWDVLVYTLE